MDGAQHHVDATVRTWLGLPRDNADEVPRLPDELVRLLLRTEEYTQAHRDQWGCWEFAFSENFRRGRLWVPEVDEWVAQQRRRLEARAGLEPLWPDGHAFAMCITHDVDMVSRRVSPAQARRALRAAVLKVPSESNTPPERALRVAGALARPAYFGVSRHPGTGDTLERCVDVELEHGVRGSYFFTVHPPRPTHYDCMYRMDDRCRFRGRRTTVAAVARELCAEGFDVGLHGSYRSAFEGGLLAEEKAILEDAVGQPAVTIRQHYLRYDVHRTAVLQNGAGFLADATLGFNRNVGFRAGTSMPFHPYDVSSGAPLDLLEVPLIAMEFALLRPNSLELDEHMGAQVTRQLIDSVAAVGGVVTLLFHPHSLLDPAVLYLYRSSLEYALAQGAWVAPLAQIDRWWRERERRLTRASATREWPAA